MSCISSLLGHSDRVWSLAWLPDKSVDIIASSSADQTVRIWKKEETGYKCVQIIEGIHKKTIRTICFAPNAKWMACGSFDGTVSVYSCPKQGKEFLPFKLEATLEGHESEVKCIAFSYCSFTLATCSRDKTIWIWELIETESGLECECENVLEEHSADVKFIRFHPKQEMLISGSYDDTIKIWAKDEDWALQQTILGHTGTVWSVAIDPKSNSFVTVSADKTVKLHSFLENKFKTILSKNLNAISYSADWSNSNQIAVGDADNNITVFQINDLKDQMNEAFTLHAHDADVNCVVFHPFLNLLASASDDETIKIWELEK